MMLRYLMILKQMVNKTKTMAKKEKTLKIWEKPNTPSDDAFWSDAYKTIKSKLK
jgi:hypothetical protein